MSRGRRAGGAVAVALLAALAVLAPSTGADSVFVDCPYVEAGGPGPAGNLMRVTATEEGELTLSRSGSEIQVQTLAGDPEPCTGGTPTVDNVDAIEIDFASPEAPSAMLTVAQRNGVLGPGATP